MYWYIQGKISPINKCIHMNMYTDTSQVIVRDLGDFK